MSLPLKHRVHSSDMFKVPNASHSGDAVAAKHVVRGDVRVVSPKGLHARPATEIATLAMTFSSSIHLQRGEQKVDAKSVLHLMMLAATEGTDLTLLAEGPDAENAVAKISAYFAEGFNE